MSDLMSNNENDPNAEAREKLAQDVHALVEASKEPNEASVESVSEVQEVSEVPEVPEIEKKARELGWMSKEERESLGKDNKNYVDPEEYVRRQPLFERIKQQKKETEEAKQLARQAMEHLVALRKEAYEQSLRNIEAQKMQTVEEGDVNKYRALEIQQQNIKQQEAKDPIIHQPAPPPKVDPEVLSFAERNKHWYNKDTLENTQMVEVANAVDLFLYRQAQKEQGLDPNTPPKINVRQHTLEIERRVKQEFKHRFENAQRQAPSTVGKSTTSNIATKSDVVSKLTPQQRQFAIHFEKHSKGQITVEMYAKELERTGRLGK